MSFLESPRFPANISYGAVGGPGYNTDVVILNSGFEQRQQNWEVARAKYDVSHGVKSQADHDVLISFFRSVKGRANGFRFKDWADYQVTQANGKLGEGVGDGTGVLQLNKYYAAGSLYEYRAIKKPVSAALYKNGSLLTITTHYTIDLTTGIVTLVADVSKTITAITKASPGQVTTSTAHGFTNGQVIYISGVAGMTEVNGLTFTITSTGSNTFTIGVNTSGYTTYTSGGTAKKFAQPSDTLTWAGEFDIPCRFDTDSMQSTFVYLDAISWTSIPVVELRV